MSLSIDLIDHIVYAVPDFDLALSDLAEKLGVNPIIGGRHLLSRGEPGIAS